MQSDRFDLLKYFRHFCLLLIILFSTCHIYSKPIQTIFLTIPIDLQIADNQYIYQNPNSWITILDVTTVELSMVFHHYINLFLWKNWFWHIVLTLFTLTFVLIAIWQIIADFKLKERKKAEFEMKYASLEIQAMQAQMNPHFIFNSINSIQAFILANNKDEALSYLSDFAKVVRASLSNVTKKMIPLTEEIDVLNSYLLIEKMRFPKKFDFLIRTIGKIDPLTVLIPPYLIQPFAENSVKHSIIHKKSTGHLIITFEKADSCLMKCTITDDGIGRERAMEIEELTDNRESRLHSIVIAENRIRLLNTSNKPDRYKVIYADTVDKKGVIKGIKVEVYLPIVSA